MKNVFILVLFCGFLYMLGQVLVKMNTENVPNVQKQGPQLDETKIREFICSLKGEK